MTSKDSKLVRCVKVGLSYILYIVHNDRLFLVVFLTEILNNVKVKKTCEIHFKSRLGKCFIN